MPEVVRAASLAGVLLAVVAACGPPVDEATTPTPIPVLATRAPAVVSGDGFLVPITGFMTLRDDVRVADLGEVLVPAAYADDARRLLRGAVTIVPVSPDGAVLERVRARSTQVALVPPAFVDPSVKTLSLDGQLFWDPRLDLARYPLRLPGRAEAGSARDNLWDLVAAGEIIFGRGVQERIENKYAGDARTAFAKVRDVTRSADLAIATLEAPLSGQRNRYCNGCIVFVGNEAYVSGITDAGIRLVTLAANHIGDAGPQGILDTVRVLDAARVAHVGAGADERAARRPARLEVRGTRVAFLGYTDVPPIEYAATATQPGHAWLWHDDATYAALRAEVTAARRASDLVVVMPHWGIEYEDTPRDQVVAAAHAMVDAGADVVLGDHPHWVQSVELYHGAYIAYGVGNFVFDQMWSPETRQGSLHRLFFAGRRLVAVRILPTLVEDYFQPRLLAPTEPQYRATLERIWRTSVIHNNGN